MIRNFFGSLVCFSLNVLLLKLLFQLHFITVLLMYSGHYFGVFRLLFFVVLGCCFGVIFSDVWGFMGLVFSGD